MSLDPAPCVERSLERARAARLFAKVDIVSEADWGTKQAERVPKSRR